MRVQKVSINEYLRLDGTTKDFGKALHWRGVIKLFNKMLCIAAVQM